MAVLVVLAATVEVVEEVELVVLPKVLSEGLPDFSCRFVPSPAVNLNFCELLPSFVVKVTEAPAEGESFLRFQLFFS